MTNHCTLDSEQTPKEEDSNSDAGFDPLDFPEAPKTFQPRMVPLLHRGMFPVQQIMLAAE